jgi:hypothetical protein
MSSRGLPWAITRPWSSTSKRSHKRSASSKATKIQRVLTTTKVSLILAGTGGGPKRWHLHEYIAHAHSRLPIEHVTVQLHDRRWRCEACIAQPRTRNDDAIAIWLIRERILFNRPGNGDGRLRLHIIGGLGCRPLRGQHRQCKHGCAG